MYKKTTYEIIIWTLRYRFNCFRPFIDLNVLQISRSYRYINCTLFSSPASLSERQLNYLRISTLVYLLYYGVFEQVFQVPELFKFFGMESQSEKWKLSQFWKSGWIFTLMNEISLQIEREITFALQNIFSEFDSEFYWVGCTLKIHTKFN
jgi:hypothetical protein